MAEIEKRINSIVEQITPDFYLKRVRKALLFSGFNIEVGIFILVSAFLSVFLAIISIILIFLGFGFSFEPLSILIGIPIITFINVVIIYNILIYFGQIRSVQIETMLPDALQLIAANIRADIPIHKALIVSARPEFGLLGDELTRIGDEVISGAPIDLAFENFSNRVQSPLAFRVSTLVKESIKSGHNLAGLLEQISHDVRQFKILEAEANANISSYVLFITMAAVIIAPVLYSVSIAFVDVSESVKQELDVSSFLSSDVISQQKGSGFSTSLLGGTQTLSADTLSAFATLNLIVTAAMASLVISVLQTGEMLRKLPMAPIYITISVAIFWGVKLVIDTVLGGIFI